MIAKSPTQAEHPALGGGARWSEALGASVSICLIAACIALFNVFPEKVGYVRNLADPASFVPLLAPEFADFLPWLNLWWGLTLVLEVLHLARGCWTAPMRAARLALDLLGAAVLASLAAVSPFTDVPAAVIVARFALPIASLVLFVSALAQLAGLLRAIAEEPPWHERR